MVYIKKTHDIFDILSSPIHTVDGQNHQLVTIGNLIQHCKVCGIMGQNTLQ